MNSTLDKSQIEQILSKIGFVKLPFDISYWRGLCPIHDLNEGVTYHKEIDESDDWYGIMWRIVSGKTYKPPDSFGSNSVDISIVFDREIHIQSDIRFGAFQYRFKSQMEDFLQIFQSDIREFAICDILE